MLLERGADPNAKFQNGIPINYALVKKYPAHTIKLLLDAGADPNKTDELKSSSLCIAIQYRHSTEVIKLLLDNGAHPDIADAQGLTPLMIAAGTGATADVPLLLKKGVRLNAAALGSADVLLLNFAKKKHRQVEVQTLLGPAATEIPGMTALHLAVFFGHTKIVRQLLNAGADPYLNTHQGISNLQFAEAMGHAEIADMLKPVNLLRAKIQNLVERAPVSKGPRYESLQKIVRLSTAEEVKFSTLETTYNDFRKLDSLVGSLLAATNFLATPSTQAELEPIIDRSYQEFLRDYPSTSIEKIIADLLSQVKLVQDKLEKALPVKGYFSGLFPAEGQALVNSLKRITDKQELKQPATAPKGRI